MKIQRPTIGRIVIFTAKSEIDGAATEHAGMITHVHSKPGRISVSMFGEPGPYSSVYNADADHDANGADGTWRYPPRCTDEIEVQS